MVSDAFAQLGVPIIDTDVIAHMLVTRGQSALDQIVLTFGPDIIDTHGELKRKELRSIIFSDPVARQKLESILHPKIRQKVREDIAFVSSAYCILVIPLLVEHGGYPNISRILVVDTEPENQIVRLMARDNTSREQAEQALDAQTPRENRLQLADDVLDNSGSQNTLFQAVAKLHKKYTGLANQCNHKAQST